MTTTVTDQATAETSAAAVPAAGEPDPGPLSRWLRRILAHAAAKATGLVLSLPRHRIAVAYATGAFWAVVSVVRMLWPTPVGLGDAGDGERLLCQIGATPPPQTMGLSNPYLSLVWGPHRYFGETCGVPTTGETYWSSQLILLRLSQWLGALVGHPAGIDFRVLAVLCSILVGVGVGLFVLALPPAVSMPRRMLVASLAGLIMVDVGIARFFASPYSEPASLLGLFLLCPALLWLLRGRRFTWGPLLAVSGIGAFVILSKTQLISLLPPLAVVLLLRPSLPPRWHDGLARRRRQRRIRRSRTVHRLWIRSPAILLVIVLTAIGWVNMHNQPNRYSEINNYSGVFATILPMSPDPQADLRWFGLDPALARGSGTNIYSPNTVAYDPAYQREFTKGVSQGRIVLFYLSQPGRLIKLGNAGLNGMANYNTERYMATYPASAHQPPYAQERRVAVFTALSGVYRAVPYLLVLQWVIMLWVFLAVTRRRRGTPARQSVGILGLFLIAAMTLQFWTVMMSDGNTELFKHMVETDLMMFLALLVLLAVGLQRRRDEFPQQQVDGTEAPPVARHPAGAAASSVTRA